MCNAGRCQDHHEGQAQPVSRDRLPVPSVRALLGCTVAMRLAIGRVCAAHDSMPLRVLLARDQQPVDTTGHHAGPHVSFARQCFALLRYRSLAAVLWCPHVCCRAAQARTAARLHVLRHRGGRVVVCVW
jgi:hypothetical protein